MGNIRTDRQPAPARVGRLALPTSMVLAAFTLACGMGDGMHGMDGKRHRMMGGDAGQEAPETRAALATAAGCPSIDQALVDRGRDLYTGAGLCASCHAADATGSQLAPGLTDADWLNIDGSYASIAEVIRSGVPEPQRHSAPMPPKGGGDLSPEGVCAVAAYVYSLGR